MVGDAAQHVGEPGLRVDVVELGGGDQRVHGRRPFAAVVGAGEEPVFAADGNRPVILPMSGRRSRSIIPGTHSMDAAFDASMSSGALVARSFTSRWRPA